MRASRVLGEPTRPIIFYHCMSRTLRELPFWDTLEKEHLRGLLAKLLAFSGLEMITYCLMGNHFHLLLAVPSERESLEAMSDQTFLERLACLYDEEEVELIAIELASHRQAGREEQAFAVRRPYLRRMHNLSAFMQELKQRFSCYFNRRHEREGTIWRGRFKSVLVEDAPGALRSLAAYIDLNPIRAAIVDDPLDYRWCGYAEAVAGGKSARQGLGALIRGEVGDDEGTRSWLQIQAIYRCWLYEEGKVVLDEHGHVVRRGVPDDQAERVLAKQGALSRPVLARCRIRHFTDGVAIGSKAFIEEVFLRHRPNFGPRRVDGARRIPQLSAGLRLMNLRDLGAKP